MPRKKKRQVIAVKREKNKRLIEKKGRIVIDVQCLQDFVKHFVCGAVRFPGRKNASKSNICQQKIRLIESGKNGFATKFTVKCDHPDHGYEFWTSKRNMTGPCQPHKVNTAFIVSHLLEGIKYKKIVRINASKGCGTVGYPSYAKIRDRLYSAVHELAIQSKGEAANSIKATYGPDIEAALDGTWSKRYGFNAKYGIVICIHETRKVIATQVYSKKCFKCRKKIGDEEGDDENGNTDADEDDSGDDEDHDCQKNWDTSSGMMEPAGFAAIGRGLLDQYGLR